MMELRLFTTETCLSLLDYKASEAQRRFYNSDSYPLDDVKYIAQSVSIDLNDTNLGTNPSDDLGSSIKIFNSLRDLDLVQANDKRLWATLTHTIFFNYTKRRWSIDENSSDDVIKDRFHFEGAALRQRNQNSIARLWWAAKITFDHNREDPYELTKLLWEKQDFYQNLIDRKYSLYKSTLKGFLNFYKKNKHLDTKMDMRKLFRGINALGGVKVLPLFSEMEVENQLYKLAQFYGLKVNDSN